MYEKIRGNEYIGHFKLRADVVWMSLCLSLFLFIREHFLCKLAFVRTTKLRDDKHQGQNFSVNGRYHNKLWYYYQNQGDVKEKLSLNKMTQPLNIMPELQKLMSLNG